MRWLHLWDPAGVGREARRGLRVAAWVLSAAVTADVEIGGRSGAGACHGGSEGTDGRKGESKQGLRADPRADFHEDRRGACRKEPYPQGQTERGGIESGGDQAADGHVGFWAEGFHSHPVGRVADEIGSAYGDGGERDDVGGG